MDAFVNLLKKTLHLRLESSESSGERWVSAVDGARLDESVVVGPGKRDIAREWNEADDVIQSVLFGETMLGDVTGRTGKQGSFRRLGMELTVGDRGGLENLAGIQAVVMELQHEEEMDLQENCSHRYQCSQLLSTVRHEDVSSELYPHLQQAPSPSGPGHATRVDGVTELRNYSSCQYSEYLS
jgi:hypothetical protein